MAIKKKKKKSFGLKRKPMAAKTKNKIAKALKAYHKSCKPKKKK